MNRRKRRAQSKKKTEGITHFYFRNPALFRCRSPCELRSVLPVSDKILCRIHATGDVTLLNMSNTDLELLARYTRQNAEDAFAELVRRHLDLVYSAALRQVRSPQLAEDVAQSTFINLAHNAHRLSPDTTLTSWLYKVTRHAAIDVVRREARRQAREQIACDLDAMNASADNWTLIEPMLDEAMHALDDTDRSAVLLRYFENKSLREVGQTLGTSEDGAQKRVSRAVDRLREFFAKRGVAVGAGGLVAVISAHAVQAAPIGLAVTISTAAPLIGTAAVTTATATKAIAMTLFQKALITTTLALGIATPWLIHIHSQKELREQNAALRQQLQQQLDTAAQLETDKARLSKLIGQATNKSLSDGQFRELLRLRGEVSQLRNQKGELEKLQAENRQLRAAQDARPASPSGAPQDYFPKESWSFTGYATPESTLQSILWAISKGDIKTMMNGVLPEEAERMAKQFEGKSQDEIAAAIRSDTDQMNGFRILKKEAVSDDQVILTVFNDGRDLTTTMKFVRVGNDWKIAGKVKDKPLQ
jgi:RNA polymerase sigma factor (sigma-70 family)